MFPEFEVIPAVDVRAGQVVQLVGGDPESGTEYGDPMEAADRWVDAGARTLHLVDLDGAIDGERADAEEIAAVVDAVEVDVQVGGGIRTVEDAATLLDRGVDRVILGTAAVEDPDVVDAIDRRYPGTVLVSLDASEGEVVVSGWTERTGLDPAEAAARFEDRGAAGILFTDVDVEGRMAGVRTDVVAEVADAVSIPVIASGGVATVEDVSALAGAGASAVVVGTALYEGKFALAEAFDAVE